MCNASSVHARGRRKRRQWAAVHETGRVAILYTRKASSDELPRTLANRRAERVSSCNSGADPVDVPLIDVSQLLGIISANLRFSWSSL
ncbi:unnamed protein product [Sphagnum balticum]